MQIPVKCVGFFNLRKSVSTLYLSRDLAIVSAARGSAEFNVSVAFESYARYPAQDKLLALCIGVSVC